jgi:hypothetical protein
MTYYVYRISGNGLEYYGSSGQPVCERISQHKSQYRYYLKSQKGNKCMSYKIFETYGDKWENNDWNFEVIEWYDTQEESLQAENDFIVNTNCINRQRAIPRTDEEMTEYKRKWAEENRRKKGVKPKVIGFDNTLYQRNWMREFRASKDEQTHQEELQKRRDDYALKMSSLSIEEKTQKSKAITARRNELWTEEYREELRQRKRDARANRTPEQIEKDKLKAKANYEKRKALI